MYQGGRELVEENAEPFGFDPASIDYLLLTRAHLDHCGRIPLLAKRIIDGAERVRIFSEEIPVHASIHTIGGFSAHADQAELLAWHQQTGKPKPTFLVHGEKDSMHSFARKLKNTQVEMPVLHQTYDIL